MRRKKNNKIFIILLVVLAIFIWYKYNAHYSIVDKNAPVPMNIDGVKIKTKEIHDTSDKYFDISAVYPTTGIGAKIVEDIVMGEIEAFKSDNDVKGLSKEELANMGFDDGRQYALNINYSSSHNTKLITHRLDIYNFTGGAHGSNTVETHTFDTLGKEVTISDLFTNPEEALKVIADKCVAKIKVDPNYKDNLDMDWLATGTAPTAENYASFMIDGANIKIVFQQYQVAPYVYGNIEVPIALSELKSFLKPEYK